MSDVQLSLINVLAELENIDWEYEQTSAEEIRCKCPAHESDGDHTPSCNVNVENRLYKCHAASCGSKGDFVTFLALCLKQPRRVIVELLSTRYDFDTSKTIDSETVERWHSQIWSAMIMLAELRKRAVSDDVIRSRRLGFDGKRITIPIPNQHGAYVNVRKYLPGAPGPEKMRNMRGHGATKLYPIDQLKYDTIILTGGEVKAIVGADRLNEHDIGCICATSGEGNWEAEFSRAMRGKRLFICMDIDEGGRVATGKVAARCRAEARWVGDILLPLDPEVYPSGDLNDYFGPFQATASDFLRLMEAAPEWVSTRTEEVEVEAKVKRVHLSLVTQASNVGMRLEVAAVATAKDDVPYIIPKTVLCTCSRDQQFCVNCPVFCEEPGKETGGVLLSVPSTSPAILSMVEAPKKSLKEAVRAALKIPKCKVVEFVTKEHYNVEDVRLIPQLQIASREVDHVERPSYYIGHGLATNSPHIFSGRVFAHPKDQHAVFVCDSAVEAEDSLKSYKPTDEQLMELTLFQPTEWTYEGIEAKLKDVYADFEVNVTSIFFRHDLHLAVDLAYHSPLVISLDGRKIKGWTEVLVMGDSSQGKSDVSQRIMGHYRLGESAVCKVASRAGLMGGLMQMGTRWFINWGIIPIHDQRLVILEELKGIRTDTIAELTDMRSSGVAEITRIEKQRTHARTRLLALSNARSRAKMEDYNFGVEAIVDLIGGLEDIRRFDMAYIVTSKQVNPTLLNIVLNDRPKIPHHHTSELCRRLVLWAWTREADQVVFTEEASRSLMLSSVAMSNEYTDAIPLVDQGSIRQKLARLSASLACRTFSCGNEDPQKVIVRPCHVDFITRFLERVYSSPEFGYKDYSAALMSVEKLVDPTSVEVEVLRAPFAVDLVNSLLHATSVEQRDIGDWCGWDMEESRKMMQFLVRKHALIHEKRGVYKKTPAFISLLKDLKNSGRLLKAQRPDFLKDVRLPGSGREF